MTALDVRGPCVDCGQGLGPDNIDRVCGPCVERSAALEVAAAIAADVIATAAQYPAIRGARGFDELHSIYDANESVIAGADATGWNDGPWEARLRVQGEAVAVVHCAMERHGFDGLARVVDGSYPA